MYNLKGFATHANLVNNTPGVIAPYGELSTQSMTYSREKGYFKSTLSNDIQLVSFNSVNNNTHKPITTEMTDHVVTIIRHVFNKAANTLGQQYSDDLALDLISNFSAIGSNYACGPMVENNGHFAPEWVSWRAIGVSGYDPNNVIKIWLSDAAFRLQYDEYTIVVVPPILNMDDFFKSGAQVESIVESYSQSDLITRVMTAKSDKPESAIRAEEFDYIDPLNNAHRVKTTWHVLIYGAAGNNIDAVTEALSNYVISRSQHTREDWIQIIPDLFKRTEYVLIPLWNQFSIPNRAIETGIYSPVIKLSKAIGTVKDTIPGYPSSHIDTHLQFISNPYKSLQIGVVGGQDNRNSWFKFTDIFTDYINVSSTSNDFGRMQQRTQEWSTMIANMLITAEYATEFNNIPTDMTKAKRAGKLFIVKRFGNVNYLIATKDSVNYVEPVNTP